MLSDREQQTLNDLEHQLLLEDPVLVQRFRNVGSRDGAETGRPAKAKDKKSRHWHRLIVPLVLGVSALVVAFVALRGVSGAVVGVALGVAAVVWARYGSRPGPRRARWRRRGR